MTEDLKRLSAALKAATPPPEDAARARALRLAQENFEQRQGNPNPARPNESGPEKPAGFVTGVKNMFRQLGTRPALYATSSLAVLGLGIILVYPLDGLTPDTIGRAPKKTETREITQTADEESQDFAVAEPQVEPVMPDAAQVQAVTDAPALLSRAASPSTQPRASFKLSENGGLPQVADQERFAPAQPNPLKITAKDPVSTFSIDVDTASYAYIRNAILGGALPDVDAVRVEEMINYFPYDYRPPADGQAFSTSVSVFRTPWNHDTKLVQIGIQGQQPAVQDRPHLNLVFLIDTSGSMQDPAKLPLLKQSFRLLLSRLTADDKVAIVTYAGSSGVVLDPTPASQRATILAALENLDAGGSTAGQAGLQQAYAEAEKMKGDGRIGRILLATDGDFNVGISDPDDLKRYVETKRESGTYLSVLGFGRGNYNDALMQSLAQNGNGTAAYIDTLSEAQKVLVDQVSGALFPIANDVKIQVEFNPATIAEYRLIGYETRILAREDFNNDTVDAGDIGAGHRVTALYEVTPVGSPALRSDPLRYQAEATTSGSDELGFLKLRYKVPGQAKSNLISQTITTDTTPPSEDAMFAAAIAGFGQLLGHGKYMGTWGFDAAIALAGDNRGRDEFGYRAEAVTLMRLAASLAR